MYASQPASSGLISPPTSRPDAVALCSASGSCWHFGRCLELLQLLKDLDREAMSGDAPAVGAHLGRVEPWSCNLQGSWADVGETKMKNSCEAP